MFAGVVNNGIHPLSQALYLRIVACAVLASDEEVCVSISRYFTKECQFTTDTYRLFAALNRLCKSPISWYSSGPTQKYMLRQIKAMDFVFVDEEGRKRFSSGKGSYSKPDESGRLIVNDDMDVALLMLYGHILYSGASYTHALSKSRLFYIERYLGWC